MVDGGPAARAGLQPGDVIVALAGRAVESPAQVIASVEAARVGQPLPVRVYRNGSELGFTVIPTEMARIESR